MDKQFAIFDMDGTLVDSMNYWKQLGQEYLRSRGVTGNVDHILQRTKPMTMSESAALFLREFGLSGTAEEIRREMNAMMDRHYREDVPLKPGVRAYLDRLKARGVTLCVASATPEPLIRICLERLGVAADFQFLLSCDEVGAGKNSPAVFLEAARRLGAEPADVAVFEDALYAAETASAAGFYTVGVWDDNSAHHWDRLRAVAQETVRDWKDAE